MNEGLGATRESLLKALVIDYKAIDTESASRELVRNVIFRRGGARIHSWKLLFRAWIRDQNGPYNATGRFLRSSKGYYVFDEEDRLWHSSPHAEETVFEWFAAYIQEVCFEDAR